MWSRAPGNPQCAQGTECDQKNSSHWKEFDHPSDHPYLAKLELQEFPLQVQVSDEAIVPGRDLGSSNHLTSTTSEPVLGIAIVPPSDRNAGVTNKQSDVVNIPDVPTWDLGKPSMVLRSPTRKENSSGRDSGGSGEDSSKMKWWATKHEPDLLGMAVSGLQDIRGNLSSVWSGLINGVILFVFCCVFSSMIFGQNAVLKVDIPIGVGLFTASTFIGGMIFGRRSEFPGALSGPDITPTVFMAEVAAIVSAELCPNGFDSYGYPIGADATYDESSGEVVHGSGTGVCEGEDLLLPTVLVALGIGALLCGVCFLLLGLIRVSGIVGFVPADVAAGFHACIGFKVIKAAVEVTTGHPLKFQKKYMEANFSSWEDSWRLLLPAIAVGLPLYILKRKHIGKPVMILPIFIFVPIVIFYCVLGATGTSIDKARDNGWYPTDDVDSLYLFWEHWTELYGSLFDSSKISWKALYLCIPTWLSLMLITCLDNLVMLASTETSLGIDFTYNHEMRVSGVASILSALLGGQPVYAQKKFAQINYSIVHSLDRALPSYACGVFCGLLFLMPLTIVEYAPRFLLGGLLLFSALGFLIENLVDAHRKYNRLSFLAIWAIFVLNIWQDLLIAIAAGLVWASFSFAYLFARKSKHTPPISGADHCSSAIRSAPQEMKLGVVGSWYHIFSLEGYIFFGTASRFHRMVKKHVTKADAERSRCARDKFLIFDMSNVFGMDVTASIIFLKVKRMLKARSIGTIWAGLAPNVLSRLEGWSIIELEEQFPTLDAAEKFVEDELLKHAHSLAQKLLIDPTAMKIHRHAVLHDAFTNNYSTDAALGASQLLVWADRLLMVEGEVVFEEGEWNNNLYLLYRGRVDVFSSDGSSVRSSVYPGAFFNETALYAPREAGTLYRAVCAEDSLMLSLSAEQLLDMQHQDPHKAHQLVLSVLRQVEMRTASRRHHMLPHAAEVNPDANNSKAKLDAANPRASTTVIRRKRHGETMARRDNAMKAMLKHALATPPSVHRRRSPSHSIFHSSGDNKHTSSGGFFVKRKSHSDPHSGSATSTHSVEGDDSFHGSECWPSGAMRHSERHDGSDAGSADAHGGEASPAAAEPKVGLGHSHHGSSLNLSRLGHGHGSGINLSKLVSMKRSTSFANREELDASPPLPVRTRTRAQSSVHPVVDQDFLRGNDYVVPLTQAQRRHYHHVFHIHDHNSNGMIEVSELGNFMDSLGHGFSESELHDMIRACGINEDADGSIKEADFHEFIRRSLVEDLPADRIPHIKERFKRAAARQHAERLERDDDTDSDSSIGGYSMASQAPKDGVDGPGVLQLLHELGFRGLDDLTFRELFNEVDWDDDGFICVDEFITFLGMLKKPVLEVMELEQSFTRLRAAREKMRLQGTPSRFRRPSNDTSGRSRHSSKELSPKQSPKLGATLSPVLSATLSPKGGDMGYLDEFSDFDSMQEHMVYAVDLVGTLGVTQEEAEEIIYIADLQDKNTAAIDFTEFRQLVVNWS